MIELEGGKKRESKLHESDVGERIPLCAYN